MKTLFIILIAGLGFTAYAQPDTVAIGTTPNDGTGDPLRTAFAIVNTNDDAAFDTLEVHLDTLQAVRVNVNDNADSLAVHLDTLQALRVDENNSFDSLAVHLDTLQALRVDENNSFDSLAVHLDTLQALRVDENNSFDSLAVHLDTLQALRIDENNSFDSLAVHLDSLQAIRVDVNSNLDSIAVSTDTAQALRVNVNINTTSFQDTLGWVNVKSYGAVGDGITDDAAAIQSAIDGAQYRIVYFPSGTYLLGDSLRIYKACQLLGAGNYIDLLDADTEGRSILQSNINKTIIYIDSIHFQNGGAFPFASEISHLIFQGSDDTDSSGQNGIWINQQSTWNIHDNTFYQLGGHGIKFRHEANGGSTVVYHNIFREIRKSAIYGRRTPNLFLGAIDIVNNYILEGYSHGIDLVSEATNIFYNTIELNDSVAIYFNPMDTSSDSATDTRGNVIKFNRLENNGGGGIFAWYWFASTVSKENAFLKIEDNTFFHTITLDKPEAEAMITIKQFPGSESFALQHLEIGMNTYNTTNNTPYVALDGDNSNGGVAPNCRVWIPSLTSPSTFFLELGEASVFFEGRQSLGSTSVFSIVAGTGITEAMITGMLTLELSGAVDISADPQIAAGLTRGQLMTIVGTSDANILTLEDGTGLDLIGGTAIIGRFDQITLMWMGSIWIEMERSMPYWEDITVTGTATIATLDYTPAHAAINFSDSATVIALTQNIWSKMTGPVGNLFVIREADGITVAGDTMTIVTDGAYEGDFGLSFDGTANDVFHVAVYKNGVVTSWEAHRKTSNNDTGNLGIPFYLVGLNAGDDISIYIRNTGDNDDATLISGQFIMKLFHPD